MNQMSMEEAYSDQLKFQHDVLAQRVTWLMTINGFLLGSFTLVIVNQDKIGSLTFGALIAVATLGAAANSSALFSNWWGTRCIRDISNVLQESWATDGIMGQDLERRRSIMRMYGRDPASFRGFQRNLPTEWLHPWLFLPVTFALSFFFAPLAFNLVQGDDSILQSLIPFSVAIPFVALILWEIKYRREDHMWGLVFGNQLEPTSSGTGQVVAQDARDDPTREEVFKQYQREKKVIKKWVTSEKNQKRFPREYLRKVHFWGIPASTLSAYRKYQANAAEEGEMEGGRKCSSSEPAP
jgi:hypothetical protein